MEYLLSIPVTPPIPGDTLIILKAYNFYKKNGSSPRLHQIIRSDTSGERLSLAITCITRLKIICDVLAAKTLPHKTQQYSQFYGINTLPYVIQMISRNLNTDSLKNIQNHKLLEKGLEGITTLMKSLRKVEKWRDQRDNLSEVIVRITLRQNELMSRQSLKISKCS